MELSGPSYRPILGCLYSNFFSFGFMAIPGIAFFVRSLRDLHFTIAGPSIILFVMALLTPESPRWMVSHGQAEKALKVVQHIAEVNRKTLPEGIQLTVDEGVSCEKGCWLGRL